MDPRTEWALGGHRAGLTRAALPDIRAALPDIRVSETLGRGYKGRGLCWAEGRIPGPARSQGEGPEGGLRGTWTPEQSVPWEATGRDEHVQHLLTSGSQRGWGGGIRGGVSGGHRRESQVLRGVKVRALRED